MTATQDLSSTRPRTRRAALSTSCALSLAALLVLPPFALAQGPSAEPTDRFRSRETTRHPEAGMLGLDPDELDALPALQDPLDWSKNPGAFEQELRRRIANPLFPVERQVVQRAELKAAKIRDASDARSALREFVELSLDRRNLARVKTVEEIDLALVRYQTARQNVMGVGGEAAPLVGALTISRASLIERWRVAHKDHPEILAALDAVMESDELDDPASHSEFAAQLLREDSPILADERAPALLSESLESIALVLATLPPEQRSELRIVALDLIQNLQTLGLEIEDEQAKLDLLLADKELSTSL